MLQKLACYICKYETSDKDAIIKVTYALKCIFNHLYKLLFLIILFSILGKINYFCFSLIILFSIRTFSGGMHFNTSISCLIFTTGFFIITALISTYIPSLPNTVYIILMFISLTIIAIKSPVTTSKRPIISITRFKILKWGSIITTISWVCFLLFYLKSINFINCGTLTITIQSLQLLKLKNN